MHGRYLLKYFKLIISACPKPRQQGAGLSTPIFFAGADKKGFPLLSLTLMVGEIS